MSRFTHKFREKFEDLRKRHWGKDRINLENVHPWPQEVPTKLLLTITHGGCCWVCVVGRGGVGWGGHFHIQTNYSVEVVLCCCWGCDNIYMYYLLQIYNFHIYILHSLCYYKLSNLLIDVSLWTLIKHFKEAVQQVFLFQITNLDLLI